MPETVKPNDLDKAARSELRTLSKENADEVARHLVMAGRLVEEEPEEAHRHALAASRRAGRVAVVRESLAITAYAVGDFALALRELRTFRRISGSDDQIGLMVDSERGVGRPDRALELGRSVDRATLPLEAQVALAIAMSGARLDLEDAQGALDELERAPIDLQRVHPWSPVLFESLAAVHGDLGDAAAAELWRRRAERAEALLEEVDEEGTTMTVSTEYPEPEVVAGSDDVSVVVEDLDEDSEAVPDASDDEHPEASVSDPADVVEESADPVEETEPAADDLVESSAAEPADVEPAADSLAVSAAVGEDEDDDDDEDGEPVAGAGVDDAGDESRGA